MFNQEVHEILTNSVLTKLFRVTALYDDNIVTAEEAVEDFDRLSVRALQDWEPQQVNGVVLIADITNNSIKTAQGVVVHDLEGTVELWLRMLYQS